MQNEFLKSKLIFTNFSDILKVILMLYLLQNEHKLKICKIPYSDIEKSTAAVMPWSAGECNPCHFPHGRRSALAVAQFSVQPQKPQQRKASVYLASA